MPEQLTEREMVRCEACGEYHYKDECEVVVIRLVKGRDCVLKPLSQPTVVREVVREVNPRPRGDSGAVAVDDSTPRGEGEPVVVQRKKNIIPPGMLAMMLSPGDPGFDQFGAKETRRV